MEGERFRLHSMQMMYYVGRELESSPIRAYSELRCEDYDHSRMQWAADMVFKSHDMLRSAVYSDGTQAVLNNVRADVALNKIDRIYEESEEYILARREEIFSMSFELDKPPLLYLEATQFSDGSALIHMYHDGIIMDGWSHEMLAGDLDAFYSGRYTEPLKFRTSYADYLRYLDEKKLTEQYKEDKAFWKEKIKNFPKAPDLRSRNDVDKNTVTYLQEISSFPADIGERVKANALRIHVSPFVVFLTAFCKAVSRYSSEKPFLINIPMAERPPELEDIWRLVGEFSSFMLYDWTEEKGESMMDALYRVQESFFECVEHNSFSGMDVVRLIQKNETSDLIAPVVFTSTLDTPYKQHTSLKKVYSKTHTSQVWADTILMRSQDRVIISVDYLEEKISTRVIKNILSSFYSLIMDFADDSESWNDVYEAPVDEKESSLIQLEPAAVSYGTNFGRILKESFTRSPEKLAAVSRSASMTYAQMKNFAGKMIEEVKKACGNDTHIRVGLLLHKGVYQAAAEAACLIGNMTFAPLEKEYPDEMLLRMLKKSAVSCLITEEGLAGKFKKLTDIPVFRVSDFVSDKEYDHSVFITESRDAECYCIHSSGTTGQPKGIILDEEGLVNCILHTNERMNITSDDACIAVTNFCHDMAVYDITGMLSAGGTVVFPDGDAEEKDPDAWLDLIKKYHVTVWNSCPSVMEMLLTEGDALECLKGQFKLIILGGEVFTAKLAAQLRDTLSPIQLYNAGGPAEATIWSILHPVTDHDIEYGIIPYGRSVPGNCYVVMDENMCVCPPGVEGIMYIRGAGVAEGYCGLPEETAKRFIMHKGVRYYDTGDVGWYFPDGLIAFGGRKDQQIEINGKRVELEGIASIIEDFEGIEKCEAVVPACNERIIAAFYTSASQIDTEKLKEHTEGLLPRYMHPSAYIRLDSFPHIFNGKVDINKLRKYEIVQEPAEERELTAAEKIILDICRDILTNTDGLVSGESFYRCGGNSLDAIKLISRIRKKTGKSITLAQFLQRPYLFAWAELIGEDAKHQENAADAKRKADIFRKPGMPLSQEQESMWLYENVNHNTRYVLSASLKLNEEISIERLCAAAADYVRSEPVLNAVFVKNENGDLLQRYADNTHGDIVKAVAVSDEELARNFIKMYADMPMDLERGPLYRFMLYETGKNSFIFNISIHHIIADEQSFIMAFKNIMSRYRSKPVRSNNGGDFFDYILLKKNEPDTEEECWKELENAGTLGKIAAPDETGPDVSDERIEIMLDMNRVKRLRNICSGQDVSLFAGFMSVWLYVLKEASDKERFSISVPMSDRNVGDFGSAFGMFIKKVLLTADVKKGQPFSRTLSVVHEGMLKASTQMKHSFAPYVRRNGLSAHMNSLYTDVMLNFIDSGSDTGYGKLEYVMDKKDVGANNLQLLAELTDESCKCSFYYNEEVYSKREAAYIAALWERMFTKVADGPDLSLPSVIKAEICDNGSESIIERFLLWAERTPDADAIADSEGTVSYAELRRSVFRFAERLSCEGIKSGDNVAVFCVQDRDTIALIYALFVLGAVYVPIDRDMPEERAEYITARCDCRMIVSAENIPYDMHDANVRKIQMKDDGRSASEEKTPIKDLSRIAYIIFTSGTTGRPKGVPIEEQWLINMCCFYSSAFNIDASSRSIMVNNYSFDGSLKTIFTPLISGGCFVAGPKIAFDVAEAADIIKRERITHLAAIPSLLKAIIQVSAEGGYSALDSVKWTISAGEKFRCAEFCEWSRSSSFGSRLANMYGPAECSCIVTACEVTPEQLESGEIPIGEPIRNKRVYLLDETGYPCDIGETGHIWIAGFGTFSGYIGASADESGLVRDIFGNGNMYRSGDMGRLRSDGSIVYAGRCDNQIKISGQRVEAEEMENVMEQFSGVHECILKQFTGGAEQYTVMFYTADSKIDVTEMREYLGRYFNKGVLPNEFVQLDSFPLNKNGKIDRSKLCEPKARPAEERTDTQPVSETEEKIRCIWCRLLRRESVPLNEDFFRLGGYSMLLYKCQSELEREFSASFPMRELLKYTTIRELAAYARSVSDLSHPTDNEKPERAETSKAMIRKRRRNE